MRGDATTQTVMLSLTTTDDLIPQDHPIRRMKPIVERALAELSPTFVEMYSRVGRPSIPPERLLKASLLIALYSVRSERQFCERLRYDLLFKWFLDLNIEDPCFDPSTFSKNKERLLKHDVARRFFVAIRSAGERNGLLSDDHFTVDGTLLEAWASIKSLRSRDQDGPPEGGGRNPDVEFQGERRTNKTHVSGTDAEARLARKGSGKVAKPSFTGHVLMENRNGLVVDVELTEVTGLEEPESALRMIERSTRADGVTLGADRGYDRRWFETECRLRKVRLHVARKRNSVTSVRMTQTPGYARSQRVRKRVEEIFGWLKTVGGGRKLRYIGQKRNEMWMTLTASAYNLVRMAKLMPLPT